ncbi:hypothetical protein CCM_04557 [Cordyceps militaris CM01]|uniref:Myb-like DNA-binding domain-containing protein n=2 Tax=Cordyceps militaris TaxID=73501 RepID=G3JFV1_CORMM|nr:uncharacterized protein CCM_04557 [Cordyceps militaris CM01]ATY66672.1 hypothetical protein A9K55_000640 [Cordyceps militaris]EGX93185.1 hypothetical protein CCM_04557 [Cordyceps militaris CM01]
MTSNADNAMARFLFAILKQKNLKDIDWTQVANDPVLLQPITNGHAARMRYSRFRSTITGHEPNKRRSSGEKSGKVSKSSSRRESQAKKDSIVKSESSISLASYPQFTPDVSPYMGDLGDDFDNPRFMTPCSDDMTQPLSLHPSAIHQIPQHSGSGLDASPVFLKQEPGLESSPDFSAFEAAIDMGNFDPGAAFDQHDLSATQTLWNDQFQDGHF